MRSFKLLFIVIIFASITDNTNVFAQDKWALEEETNFVGSISGTIQAGHIFKTSSGSIYEVTGLTLQLVLELSPNVIVLRRGETFKLIVEGFDEELICSQLKTPINKIVNSNTNRALEVVESRIEGDFNGWEGETIFKLDNGQIWQQSSYSYTYAYKYRPKVIIYPSKGRYLMRVEGMKKNISVVKLK